MRHVEPASGRVYRERVRILVGCYGSPGNRRERTRHSIDVKCADGPVAVIRDVHGGWPRLVGAHGLERSAQSRSENAQEAK